MKIRLISVGNLKEKYWQESQNEYIKRLSKFCKFELIELKEKNHLKIKDKILSNEAVDIEKNLLKYNILLDVKGKQLSSEAFSEKVDNLKIKGVSSICFIIGSSYGVDEKIKNLVNEKISFSNMTFPHQLARIMLLEQIYRSFCISNNITYHK